MVFCIFTSNSSYLYSYVNPVRFYTYQKVKEMDLDFRFKEYAPYNEILKDGVSKEIIDRFDRTEYMSDDIDIKDLSSDQYMELLFAEAKKSTKNKQFRQTSF